MLCSEQGEREQKDLVRKLLEAPKTKLSFPVLFSKEHRAVSILHASEQ